MFPHPRGRPVFLPPVSARRRHAGCPGLHLLERYRAWCGRKIRDLRVCDTGLSRRTEVEAEHLLVLAQHVADQRANRERRRRIPETLSAWPPITAQTM